MRIGQIRQGDVFLLPVKGQAPPAGMASTTQAILAEGEATGHAHRVLATEVYDWSVGQQRYIRTTGPGSIQHEDHDPEPVAVLAPDVTYQVVPQHEWDLAGQWRRVMD